MDASTTRPGRHPDQKGPGPNHLRGPDCSAPASEPGGVKGREGSAHRAGLRLGPPVPSLPPTVRTGTAALARCLPQKVRVNGDR